MATQALYLKYRPQTFEDVVGQQPITRTLRNALRLSDKVTFVLQRRDLFQGRHDTVESVLYRALIGKQMRVLVLEFLDSRFGVAKLGGQRDMAGAHQVATTAFDAIRQAVISKLRFIVGARGVAVEHAHAGGPRQQFAQ